MSDSPVREGRVARAVEALGVNRVRAMVQAAAAVSVATFAALWFGWLVRVFTWAAGF